MAAGLGFKDFTTGEVLTANDVDGYLMQGVWVFASAAARDAAVTSPQEGNFAYLKDTNVTTYYTGSAWANLDTTGMTNPMTTTGDMIYSSPGSTPVRLGIGTAGQVLKVNSGATAPEWGASPSGLTLITTQTISGVSAQSVNNCFSATYDNYLIVFTAYATGGDVPTLKMRASGTDSTSGYYASFFSNLWTNNSTSSDYTGNEGNWRTRPFGGLTTSSTGASGTTMTIYNPFKSVNTSFSANYMDARTTGGAGYTGGIHNVASSYDGFTITNSSAMTGTVRVYGLAN